MLKNVPFKKKKDKKKKTSRLTMMIVPHCHDNRIKSYCLPLWLTKAFVSLSVVCILIVGYFVTGYFYLRYLAEENIVLKKVNTAQAIEINELKGLAGNMHSKLEALIKLDSEVREKVGLVKEVAEDRTPLEVNRSEHQYALMTMGVGGIGGQSVQLSGDNMLCATVNLASQDNTSSTVNGADSILQLPFDNEESIDTLDELREQLAKMDMVLTQQAEVMDKLNNDVDRQLAYMRAIPNAWPIQGRITSTFGYRTNPFNRSKKEFHDGLDIAAAYGSPIRAAGGGIVSFAGYKSGWGYLVVVSHGFGYVSQYAHNSRLLVKKGDKIERGQIIARIGNTGRSSGPHVHFGVALNGKWINPLKVLK